MKMRKTFSLMLASVMLLTSLFTVGFAELSDEAQNYLNEARKWCIYNIRCIST